MSNQAGVVIKLRAYDRVTPKYKELKRILRRKMFFSRLKRLNPFYRMRMRRMTREWASTTIGNAMACAELAVLLSEIALKGRIPFELQLGYGIDRFFRNMKKLF